MNFLYSLYFILPNFARIGLPGKVINRVLAIILKRIFDLTVPSYLRRTASKAGYGLNTVPKEEKYIVSLTSFPARINDVWISIETILRQSFKPDKIILWLADEQFPDKKLPKSLLQLKKRGLTINFCDDLKSHKKYYYSILNFPNSNIITIDDDVYYPKNLLKHLIELHFKHHDIICANRTHKLTFKNDKINPYRSWKHNYKNIREPSHLLFQVGVGGVLYPPGSLSDEVFNKNLIKNLCFHADDIWLKIMAMKNNTMIVTNKYFNKDFISVGLTQKQKLVTSNVFSSGNDKQFKDVINYFRIDLKDIILHPSE